MMKSDDTKVVEICDNCRGLTTHQSICAGGTGNRAYVNDKINMKHENLRDYMDFGVNGQGELIAGTGVRQKDDTLAPDMHVSGKTVAEKSGVNTTDYWEKFYSEAEYRKRKAYGNRRIYSIPKKG